MKQKLPNHPYSMLCVLDSHSDILIPQASPGVVTCMENTKHGLETGDTVTFREVVGMTTLNGTTRKVKGEFPSIIIIIL